MACSEITARIAAARHAVLAQTELLHREFGRVKSERKADGTRVTAVDVAISENIFRELRAQFPADQFFSEELADSGAPIPVTSQFAWVLDPVDGTNNYALGIPHCAISLGLVRAGQPAYGVVYDLSRRVLLHCGPGLGAWDGERALRVNDKPLTPETLIGFHSPADKKFLPLADAVLGQFKIRGLGTATLHLAYVAAGLLDGCVDFNVKIWDLAAAVSIVLGAGGEVHFLNGEQFPMRQFDLKMPRILYCAGSPAMSARLRGLMQT